MRNKPTNMKYTDLCIYIDQHLYERDENNNPIALKELSSNEIETIYSYLYHIIIALSIKKRLMPNQSDYTEFAIESADKLLGRVTKKNQDFTSTSRNNKPVKSILNYMKGCLGFLAISFREEHYNQIIKPERDSDLALGARDYVEKNVISQYTRDIRFDSVETLDRIPMIVDEELSKTIYKKKSIELNDLKLSFYISMLNMLTLDNKSAKLKDNKKDKKLFKQLSNRDDYIITWNNTDSITKSVVQLQTRKILLSLQEELEECEACNVPTQDMIDDILATALPTYGLDHTGEK